MNIRSIWIENEVSQEANGYAADPTDTNTDVLVTMTDQSCWTATFFSYANILSLTAKNRRTGECLNGRYFWACEMVLVDEVTRVRIEEVINHLLTTHEFETIFNRCDPADDEPVAT